MTTTIDASTIAAAATAAGVDAQTVRRCVVGLPVAGRDRIVDALEQLGVDRGQLDRIAGSAVPGGERQLALRLRARDSASDALDEIETDEIEIDADALERIAERAEITVIALRRHLRGTTPITDSRVRDKVADGLAAEGVPPLAVDAFRAGRRDRAGRLRGGARRIAILSAGDGALRISARDAEPDDDQADAVEPMLPDQPGQDADQADVDHATDSAPIADSTLVGRDWLIQHVTTLSRARSGPPGAPAIAAAPAPTGRDGMLAKITAASRERRPIGNALEPDRPRRPEETRSKPATS